MNPTIDLLLARKSVRAYQDRPVEQRERDLILQCALRAPTAGNMTLYSIIEIEDSSLKERLAVTCDNQPFIAKAPYLLLFLADYQRWYDYYLAGGVKEILDARQSAMRCPQEGDLLLACSDTMIAAHSAVVAAEALGIGSCYIGDILERWEIHREMFGLPQYVLPLSLICFGYPTADQAARQQTPRFEREYIVHRDRYHRLEDRELHAMFRTRHEELMRHSPRKDGIENPAQLNYFKKFSSEFMVEMTRSVQAMIASWTG